MPEKPGPDVYFNFSGKPGGVSAFSVGCVFDAEISHVRNELLFVVVVVHFLFCFETFQDLLFLEPFFSIIGFSRFLAFPFLSTCL